MSSPATATQMSNALQAREVSSAELVEASLAGIDARDREVGAFISLADPDKLRSAARGIDDARARGESVPAFAGVPIALKDNIAIAGERLTCGSRMLERYITPFSATAASRLQRAGLLVVGKTNMDEFGFGSSTENSAFFPTRNPCALDRVPGGTSGGSAAAVAAGFVPWALGSDTGGSVRQPAALCGIVGVRPSYGRVSRSGLVSYSSSMDQIGPLARTVQDAASLLSIVAGHDPLDSTTLSDPLAACPEEIAAPLKLGVPDEYLGESCSPAVRAAVARAAGTCERLGWHVASASLPLTAYALAAYYVIASVEAASNLERYDGVRYGHRSEGSRSWAEMLTQTRTEGFGSEAKRRIMLGTFASSAGYEDEYYGQACRVRSKLAAEFASAFERFDVLLSPVSPTTAWPLGERVEDPVRMYLSDVYSVPASLAGIPAVAIPVGVDGQGLPLAVQLCGPRLGDSALLAAASALQDAIAAEQESSA
jgi:aspartyl-tRNA(Asn)/glutamyl-tRNA(Gln) amidotransferase subunit A